MNIILFDDNNIKKALLPFTFTRPVSEIRVGIFKISEKWSNVSGFEISYLTETYLSNKFKFTKANINFLINGSICPDKPLFDQISKLKLGDGLCKNGILLAACLDYIPFGEELENLEKSVQMADYESEISILQNPWDIFRLNGEQIKSDFRYILSKRTSEKIKDEFTVIYNKEDIFIEEGAIVKAAILNAEGGPIYIGKNAEIQEGSIIRGPFALCEGAVLNMGSKMRGDTTIGPYSKVGGEINNSVIFGYSNKAHDGFLGNSVIAEWCNLGADTNTSNLKNNYSNVKVWNYKVNDYVDSGRQFCGLMMGDHSKSGINSMFNTGTVVGVNANIFGGGFPPKFIPSYAWGGSEGFQKFDFDKAMQVAAKVMERRNRIMENEDYEILRYIYNS